MDVIQAWASEHPWWATYAAVYLSVGLVFGLVNTIRGVHTLERRRVTYVGLGGEQVTEEVREFAEFAVGFAFSVLGWPVYLGFKFVYVPIHDLLTLRAFRRDLPPWPPTD